MRISQMYFKTYKEDPMDEELYGQKLLVRAGFMKKQANGLYALLPLGLKVVQNIRDIIKEEMDEAGAMEIELPILVPEEVYSSRLKNFGKEMFKSYDRNGKMLCLAPTSEEAFALIVKDVVTSYRQLPVILYQIQKKFRDEKRPRYGLQRSREFCMKDAYSFDRDIDGMNKSFEKMKAAYIKIFNRMGLDFVPVDADNGSMGGSGSTEFMVKSKVGEADIVVCDHCNYASNVEKAPAVFKEVKNAEPKKKMELVHTPNMKTVEDLENFFNIDKSKFAKVVAYAYDDGVCIAVVRGDREVEETKLMNHLKATTLDMATAEQIEAAGTVPGFIGPDGSLKNVTVVADNEIKNMVNFVMGANKKDHHFKNANVEDLKVDAYIDLRAVVEGDACPHCGAPLKAIKGIEVGHIFKLGTRYTQQLNCKYLDENGREQLMQMGCYGIGLARTMSSVVEQMADEKGMRWPKELAPYKATIVIANIKDGTQVALAEKLYGSLKSSEVLLDDRKDSFGAKVKDAELIGVSNVIICGKGAQDGMFEVIDRWSGETKHMTLDEVVKFIK